MMPNKRSRYLLITTFGLAGLVTIGAAAALQHQQSSQSEAPHKSGQDKSAQAVPADSLGQEHSQEILHSEEDIVPVRVFRIGTNVATESSQSLTGTVKARFEHVSSFRISGKILKRYVNVGERVVPGKLLFELDREDYELQHKTALANVEVAKASVAQSTAEERRINQLRKTNAVSASEYERSLSERDIAVGRLDAAEKQLELAINQLEYCEVRSDVEGTIVNVDVEAGQVVVPGMALCTTAQSGEVEAVVDIPENRLASYDSLAPNGVKLEVSFWSLPDISVRAKLRELSPSADPKTRTYRGRFTLENPPEQVRLGMTATVHLKQSLSQASYSIPSTAILRAGNTPAVWRVDIDTGKLTAVPVKLEEFHDASVTVSGDLKDGDLIVSAGIQKLDASRTVRVWEVQK